MLAKIDQLLFLGAKMNHKHKPLLITTGEPAGIGMDIVIDVLANQQTLLDRPVLICADAQAFAQRINLLGKLGKLKNMPTYHSVDCTNGDYQSVLSNHQSSHQITLLNIPCTNTVRAGILDRQNACMVEKQLALAHHLAINQHICAIVTAPIQKSVMIDANIKVNGGLFSGHTEYFMHQAGCDKVVMMLANQTMKVALVTTHIPLKDVANAITQQEVHRTVSIVYQELKEKFAINAPKILVCGLNPHAGESGHLGNEEMTVINPVLQSFIDQGMDISLALPADTLFTPKYLSNCDAVIAMYHDQGLAPLKSHGFGDTVNITLGLPYVRTSVDHGTALDLAGTGKASSSSLIQAIRYAKMMSII